MSAMPNVEQVAYELRTCRAPRQPLTAERFKGAPTIRGLRIVQALAKQMGTDVQDAASIVLRQVIATLDGDLQRIATIYFGADSDSARMTLGRRYAEIANLLDVSADEWQRPTQQNAFLRNVARAVLRADA